MRRDPVDEFAEGRVESLGTTQERGMIAFGEIVWRTPPDVRVWQRLAPGVVDEGLPSCQH